MCAEKYFELMSLGGRSRRRISFTACERYPTGSLLYRLGALLFHFGPALTESYS
jgi:hypothetical protein